MPKKIEVHSADICSYKMPIVYPHTFSSEGTGPWWGIRCSTRFYQSIVRQLDNSTRCFVYMTNIQGETLAIAIEGPYTDDIGDDIVFVPPWVLERLTLSEGEEVIMEPILEPLPNGEAITIRPLTGATVEGPMFLEGLTEALNQLGVIQKGILSAVVDPSLPELHQFVVESLTPNSVCLADGELRVEIERAVDRPPTPVVVPVAMTSPVPVPVPVAMTSSKPEPEEFPASFLPVAAIAPAGPPGIFVPFSGRGRRLDGKPSE